MPDYRKTLLKVACTLLIIMIGGRETGADVFTSTLQMKKLPLLEAQMITLLKEYMDIIWFDVFNEVTNTTQRQVKELEKFYVHTIQEKKVMGDNKRWMENPINNFHLLRRMARQWNGVIRFIKCHRCAGHHPSRVFTDIAELIRKKRTWPKQIDFEGAAVALTRLVTTYQLNIDDLANGRIYDVQSSSLSAEDFSLIGDVAMEKGMFHEAAIMYNMSNIIIKRTENYVSTDILYNLTLDEVFGLSRRGSYLKLLTALLQAGAVREYDEILTEAGTLYPEIYFPFKMLRFTQQNDVQNECTFRDLYIQLCNSDPKTVDETSELYCTYWPTSSALIKGKAEYMNLDPPVVVFHDVLSDLEIRWLQMVGYIFFERSAVSSKEMYSDMRISQTSWLGDSLGEVVIKLSKRIETLTRLDVMKKPYQLNSEDYQLVNYGIGGMYEPHLDATATTVNDAIGARIATWMFYLSDVKYGGATVFPVLKTRVEPKKGIAVFWWDLKRNGRIDRTTYHAGCPVIVGDKWIANKWIHERGQFRTRPCALDRSM